MVVYRRVFHNTSGVFCKLFEKDALKPGSLNVYAKNAMGISTQTRWNKVWYKSYKSLYANTCDIFVNIYLYIEIYLHEWLIFKENVG